MSKKHKYIVTFYKYSRIKTFVCTRTHKSVIKFALKKFFTHGLFTIKRLDK